MYVMLMQMSIREGMKMFGDKGSDGLLKEFNQLHERNTLWLKRNEDISYDERKNALGIYCF